MVTEEDIAPAKMDVRVPAENGKTNGWAPPPIKAEKPNSTFSGLLWTFIGTGGQAILQLVVLVVLAHLLLPEDFGVVTGALLVIGFSTIFSQVGIGPALVQRTVLLPAHVGTAFTISVFLGFAFGGMLWLLAPAIAAFFSFENFTPVLCVLSVVFPLQGLGVVSESLLQRHLRFRCLAVVELLAMFLGYGVLGITLAFLGFGIWALVAAHITQVTLKTVMVMVAQPHEIFPFLDRKALRELLNFGGGFAIAQTGNYLAGQGDNLVIGGFLGAVALGIYGRAYQLMAGPAVLLGQVLDKVLFPVMAKMQERSDHLQSTYRRSIALIALVILPTSVFFLVLAPELIAVLLGPDWNQVVVPFQILAVGMIFRASYKISDVLVRATGAVYRRAWRQAAFAALVIGGAWVGQHWGVPGVALSVLVALAINFLLMAHLSLREASMTWQSFLSAHLPGLSLTALVGLGTFAVASLLRGWEVAPSWILLLTGTAVLLLLLLVPLWPQLFLGKDGRRMLRSLIFSRTRTRARLRAQRLSAQFAPRTSAGVLGDAAVNLCEQLFAELAAAHIRYCHWKGNYSLQKAFVGADDFDLLVDPKDKCKFEGVLAHLGFKEAIEPSWQRMPPITHYYGLEPATGTWIHLHVYYRLIVGGNLLENYRLPVEELFLANTRTEQGILLPSRGVELMVFVLRTMMKHSSVTELLMFAVSHKDFQPELNYLMAQDESARTLDYLRLWLPALDEKLFLQCLASLQAGNSWYRRYRLARKLRRQLRPYRQTSALSAFWQQTRLLLHGIGLRLRGKRSRKKPAFGGAVIAFVGPDACGKSTLVRETTGWLGKIFHVQATHFGKPPATWLTLLPNAARLLVRWLAPSVRDSNHAGPRKNPGLLYRLAAVLLAWDRRALAIRLFRKAARGHLIVCDRFPSTVAGAMDSTRLTVPADGGGSLLHNLLARWENRIYHQIPPPDVVFQLVVPVDVAIDRNRTRSQADVESYLVRRHTSVPKPSFINTRTIQLDTNQPMADSIRTIRYMLWSAL